MAAENDDHCVVNSDHFESTNQKTNLDNTQCLSNRVRKMRWCGGFVKRSSGEHSLDNIRCAGESFDCLRDGAERSAGRIALSAPGALVADDFGHPCRTVGVWLSK